MSDFYNTESNIFPTFAKSQKLKKMKKIITILLILLSIKAAAQSTNPDQTVCTGEVVEYSIDSPTASSKYIWSAVALTMGKYDKIKQSDNGDKVTIKWLDFGFYELTVYEQDEAGCIGPASKIIIQATNGPSAEFDNAQNCYGEPLKIELKGTAPFSVEYTLDGEQKSISNISIPTYTMPNVPGKYVIKKVTDKTCSSEPSRNNEAIIGKEMKTLRIKMIE